MTTHRVFRYAPRQVVTGLEDLRAQADRFAVAEREARDHLDDLTRSSRPWDRSGPQSQAINQAEETLTGAVQAAKNADRLYREAERDATPALTERGRSPPMVL